MFCKNCGKENKENLKFCKNCGAENAISKEIVLEKKNFFTKRKLIILGLVILILIFGVWLFIPVTPSTTTDQEIAKSVVNIYCEGDTEEDISGGSGTIMTDNGLVLTNAHIIPVLADEEPVPVCLVILPDPSTGAPSEIYSAYPIVISEISEQYDLAFVQIHDVFIDDEGVAHGDYPKVFPAYDDTQYCKNENVILGEPVKIYGYPAISGGYALTITDGVVSSLLVDEGLIFTSAKISHGNSGGLAVDQYGCRIGIPVMVNGDENESLGIIISNDLIFEFMGEVKTILDSI